MDERNYQHSYENGSTKPPKNRGGIIAVVLCTVIFLCGILSALGMWEQNNIHNNPQIGDVNFSGDNGSGSVSSMPSSLGAAQPPNPSDQIQVLSPTRKGGVGTVNLNKLLQASLNPAAPDKKERPFGDYIFREGDRVMQIRNNYDIIWKRTGGSEVGTGIFNGDVGSITSIDPNMETVTVVWPIHSWQRWSRNSTSSGTSTVQRTRANWGRSVMRSTVRFEILPAVVEERQLSKVQAP